MKTKKEIKIKAGVATKYKKVDFDVAKIIALYKSGTRVPILSPAAGEA